VVELFPTSAYKIEADATRSAQLMIVSRNQYFLYKLSDLLREINESCLSTQIHTHTYIIKMNGSKTDNNFFVIN